MDNQYQNHKGLKVFENQNCIATMGGVSSERTPKANNAWRNKKQNPVCLPAQKKQAQTKPQKTVSAFRHRKTNLNNRTEKKV
jgi:hypothetical protein